MRMRPIIAVASAVILLGLNGFLAYKELSPDETGRNNLAPSEARVRHEKTRKDPLFDQKYVTADRERNLQQWGLDGELLARTTKAIRLLDERQRDRLRVLVQDTEDPQAFIEAVCGFTNDRRPRYGALEYVIEIRRSQRMPLDLGKTAILRRQEWAVTGLVDGVYNEVELQDNPPADSTRMAVAAVLTGQEQAVLEGQAPWGRGAGSWDWERVLEEHPGVDEQVVQTLALVHVLLEAAFAPEGPCGT